MASSPVLSFSTISRCELMVGSAVLASPSDCIWRWMATLARESNLSALLLSPAERNSSALEEAASALLPQSEAALMSSL